MNYDNKKGIIMNYEQRPVIGIIAKPLLSSQLKHNLWTRLVVNDAFREQVYLHGGIPISIMTRNYYNNPDTDNIIEKIPDLDKECLLQSLSMVDGIILQGGLTGDTYEIEIVKYALENDVPIMGVCAGFNNIARAVNLPVILKDELAKVHDVYDADYRHPVYINKKHPLSYIFHEEKTEVNSLHRMFVENKGIPDNIEVLATSSDGHIEAFTVKDNTFCLAVKWHPEIMYEKHQKELFGIFVLLSDRRRKCKK